MHPIGWSRRALISALLVAPIACHARSRQDTAAAETLRELRPVPGCEGCEAVWERDAATLPSQIRLAPPGEPGEPMLLTGTVFKTDGKTPAPGVVLYLHHTNAEGLYANGSSDSEWSKRHGRLRGWLKTGNDGRYEVLTIKPGRYPDRSAPAHVHIFLLDGPKAPYWVDDVVFEGEPGVDAAYRAKQVNRGASGIVQLQRGAAGRWMAKRDIVLE